MARARKTMSSFGEYLVQAIREANLSQFEYYTEAAVAKPYFYDILSGKANPPPRETLERMLAVLEAYLPEDPTRRNSFFNLAAKCRQEIPTDICELIKAHPERWDNIREVLNNMLAQ